MEMWNQQRRILNYLLEKCAHMLRCIEEMGEYNVEENETTKGEESLWNF